MNIDIGINNNVKNEGLKNLIHYNIVFHYHNEPIELLTYYLNNLKFLFNNMIENDNCEINIIVNFFVSNLKIFKKLLRDKKFINSTNFNDFIHKIYENNANYVKTKYIKIKPNDYNFEIIIHEIVSKPNKNIYSDNYNNIIECYDNNKNIKCNTKTNIKINNDDIIDGSKSIGFKRYVANIMSWNIYEKLNNDNKNEKIFNQMKVFLFQIDFGTIIGLHILLHNSINNILLNDEQINLNKNNNKIFSFENFNYWFETKKFLSSNKFISNSYLTDVISSDNIETLYSQCDFYFFLLTHLLTVIQNFNIVHFTTLSIKQTHNKIIYNNKKINTIPNKPINYFDEYYKLNKMHYDKFYITDISLTFIHSGKISRPITYNKNYTSFSEDLLYTNLLFKLKKLIVPHPFLNITKCSYRPMIEIENKLTKNKNTKYELIYIFLPYDDICNYKSFDILNYIKGKKHDIEPQYQNDEITQFHKNALTFQTNELVSSNDIYNILPSSVKIELIDNNKINCDIQNKTNTNVYKNKYKNSKDIFEFYNKNNYSYDKNILFKYKDLLVAFDSDTNKTYYEKILRNIENNDMLNYYNNEYNFYNAEYKIPSHINLKYPKNNNLIYLISDFIHDYITNFLQIKNLSKEIANETIFNVLDKIDDIININNSEDIYKYKNKYIKYKSKYLELKKNICSNKFY